MTISSTTRIAGPFVGNGTATVLPYTFKIFAAADLDVVRLNISTGVETTLVLNSDYSVTLNGDQNSNPGGSITLLAGALATGYTLVITSDIANLQPTDLTNQGGFYPEVITDALDRATIQIQQISDIGDRTLKIPITDGSLNMELPTAAERANSFLSFDANGLPSVVTAGSSGAPATITRQVFSGTGSQTVFTLASDPGALGNSAQVYIGGVYQQRSTYTIAGTTLTFSAAPVAGTDNIEFVNFLTSNIGATSADLVTYTPAGSGAVARSAASKFGEAVTVRDYGSNLATALTAIGATVSELIINDDVTVSANTTIPSTLKLIVTNGSVITVNNAVTMTINGPFECGAHQCFTLVGTGVANFGLNTVAEVLPQWWGAKGDGTVDCTSAIRSAFRACQYPNSYAGKITFMAGTYVITDEIEITANQMLNVLIEGQGSDSATGTVLSNEYVCNIIYNGAVDGTKAMFRFTPPSSGETYFKNIALNANSKAGFCVVIGTNPSVTYHNTLLFDAVRFSSATKIGVLIGNTAGTPTPDVDSYQVNFWQCWFDRSPIGIYANAQNNYGPFVERCIFANSIPTSSTGFVINHIRTDLSGHFIIKDSFFHELKTETSVIDPITGIAVVDADIACMYLRGYGVVSDCLTEEVRVLKLIASGTQQNHCVFRGIGVNDTRTTDGKGRNLTWESGATGVYCVNNDGGNLHLDQCQFGGAAGSADVQFYRKMYNNGRLSIDTQSSQYTFLGVYGEVVHGASSAVETVNGTDPANVAVSNNWSLSRWQDANTPLDGITKFNGTSGVSTITQSSSNVAYGKYTLESVTTVAATTFCSGLQLPFRSPTSKRMTLVVAGYAATWYGIKSFRDSATGITPDTTDGNNFALHNATTSRFVAALPFTVTNTFATERLAYYVGLPSNQTGTYFYDALLFIPGVWTLAEITAMLPFLGNNPARMMGYAEQHYGTAAPTVGEWWRGDIVWNQNAASGGTPGWMCTTGNGTSAGTWKAMANLA